MVGKTHTKQLFGRQRRRVDERVEFLIFCVCRRVVYNAWEYSTEYIKWHKFTISLLLYLYMHILVVYIKTWSFLFSASYCRCNRKYVTVLTFTLHSQFLPHSHCITNWLMLWWKIKCCENHTKHKHASHRQSADL